MTLPLLLGAALVFLAWACRRVTRPLPAPDEVRYRDAFGREYGTLTTEQLERLIRNH